MKVFSDIGIQVGNILLPREGIDLNKWAVIACDQFTSQPEYWKKVDGTVGHSPSTLRMVLPEVYLGKQDEEKLIENANQTMLDYLQAGMFQAVDGFILVERRVAGHTRHGLMLSLDLDRYDFQKGSQSLIRATEGTILERLPPRIRIREKAPLEIPHILVLIDDPEKSVIEPLIHDKINLKRLYDFDLMLGSGHISGYLLNDPTIQNQIVSALQRLGSSEVFRQKYGLDMSGDGMLFAMGDGNHSLATAKSCWEKIKHQAGPNHPARYALVEIENVHDQGLVFEPIHRVIFQVKGNLKRELQDFFHADSGMRSVENTHDMKYIVDEQSGTDQKIGVIIQEQVYVLSINNPKFNLPIGSIQSFLDHWTHKTGCKIDYLHGFDVTCDLGSQPGNAGFYLPVMQKTALFKTVLLDGALPRKTFSMGEAVEKRFYLESRMITNS